MFPLQRGNELVIPFSNSPQRIKISEDLILDHDYASLRVTNSDKEFSEAPLRSKVSHGSNNNPNEYQKKKKMKMKMMIHREIERQRRQEMATLHATLRSLIPLKYIKGKRSISDHTNGSVTYIKHLQKNIQELGAKRDELKKVKHSDANLENPEGQNASRSFTVHENNGIVGIGITSNFKEERFPLSKLLELLLEEGLEVVSCLSTQVNGRILHSVHCEVNSSNGIDLLQLRRKVAKAIPSCRCSC